MTNPNTTYAIGLAHIEDLRRQAASARLAASARQTSATHINGSKRLVWRGPRAAVLARVARVRSAS
jgi:hypothetical protein